MGRLGHRVGGLWPPKDPGHSPQGPCPPARAPTKAVTQTLPSAFTFEATLPLRGSAQGHSACDPPDQTAGLGLLRQAGRPYQPGASALRTGPYDCHHLLLKARGQKQKLLTEPGRVDLQAWSRQNTLPLHSRENSYASCKGPL